MLRDISKAILSNLEAELKDLEATNLENEDTQHYEHSAYSVDEQQSSEGENHDLLMPPSWNGTIPQWKDLNKEADWSERETWADIKAERLYNWQ